MVTLYLIRHGEKEKIAGDPALTPLGRKQALLTAEYIKTQKVDLIITSPKKRTHHTANILNQSLNLPLSFDSRLEEKMNWGDKEGETFEEFLNEWRKTELDRQFRPSHGDSSINTGKRIKSVLDDLSKKYKNKKIVVVTHGGAISDFLQNVFPEESLTFSIDKSSNSKYIEISECSITLIQKEGHDYRLIRVNDTSHLFI